MPAPANLPNPCRAPTVGIVDDSDTVRRTLKGLLDAAGLSVEEFRSAEEFLESGTATHIGCVVLDVELPGMNGLALHELLSQQADAPSVIILSGHTDVPMAVSSMRRGAVTVLQKPAPPHEFLLAVRETLAECDRRRRSNAERDEIEQQLALLTPREREVLDLLVQGKSPKTIARALGTTESTVRVQRASILRKMRADSAMDLLRIVQLRQQREPVDRPFA